MWSKDNSGSTYYFMTYFKGSVTGSVDRRIQTKNFGTPFKRLMKWTGLFIT